MRGLFISWTFPPVMGGSSEYAYRVVKGLTERGEDLIVATLHYDYANKSQYRYAWPVLPLGGLDRTMTFMDQATAIAKAAYIIAREDIAYVITDINPESRLALTISLSCAMKRVPHIQVIHHFEDFPPPSLPLWSTLKPPLRRIMRRINLYLADRVVVVSCNTARDAKRWGARRVHTIRNAVDLEAIKRYQLDSEVRERAYKSIVSKGFPEQGKRLLTVARLEKSKGVDKVIEVMPRLDHHEVSYIVAGSGVGLPYFRELCAESEARNAIVFLSDVSDEEKWALYNHCDIFVMPSSVEGFGIVYIEAAAFGKPSVGLNIMGVPEAVVHGMTGLLTSYGDADGLAAALDCLLSDPIYAQKLGRAGQNRVLEEFSWDRTADDFKSLL